MEPLTPTNPALVDTISAMQARGIDLVYGRWLIDGAPRVLLLDTKTGYRFLDEWKGDLWNTAGIPSPPGDDETNEAVVFGYLIAWFLGEVGALLSSSWPLTEHPSSFWPMKRTGPSSPIFMNGLPESLYHSPRRDV